MTMQTKESNSSPFGNNKALRQVVFQYVSRSIVLLLKVVVYPIARLTRKQESSNRIPRHLLIGAGVRGWDLIEYKEIYSSAAEYLGENNVSRVAFTGERPMLAELREALTLVQPTYYYYDPRSGSQTSPKALWESLMIGAMLERRNITPICALTDFPVRLWRLQVAIVSARTGVVTSLMSPSVIGGVFPHKRIVGPIPFPLSVATLTRLQNQRNFSGRAGHPLCDTVVSIGMLYEPRKTMIEAIQKGLAERGIPMTIIGRMPDGSRISDDEYWDILINAKLVISTSSQIAGRHTDFDGYSHFIYKFIEITAAGTALAIEPVTGSDHLLTPDIHYISFKSVEEAIKKIAEAWASPTFLSNLAQSGSTQADAIVRSGVYWNTILGKSP